MMVGDRGMVQLYKSIWGDGFETTTTEAFTTTYNTNAAKKKKKERKRYFLIFVSPQEVRRERRMRN